MIVLNVNGQSCNKLFVYRNYIARCLRSKDRIFVLAPDIMVRYFPKLIDSTVIRFPFYSSKVLKFVSYEKYIGILNMIFANRLTVYLLQHILKILPGINFFDTSIGEYSNSEKNIYDEEIRGLFDIELGLRNEVDRMFQQVKSEDDPIICGVHIRYGDYRLWQGGKYFFTLDQYECFMKNFKRLFPERPVVFLIASNERIDLEKFEDLSCFQIDNGSAIKDLYGLSQCNYLIGPPSSFSGWASFYGKVPLLFVTEPNPKIEKSSFKNISEIWS